MSNFKKDMFSGVAYGAISKYSGIVVSLLVTMVLARMLTPEDFGVLAIATVIIAFFAILSDLGLGAAIIQNRNLDSEDLSSLYSLSVYLAFTLAIIFFISSFFISLFYENEVLKPVCQLLSLNVFFSTINLVPNALLLREKQFKFIAIRTLLIQMGTGVLSVIAAILGTGVYALLISPIIGTIIIFFINYRRNPVPFTFVVAKSSIKKVASYSFYQFAFAFSNYFTRNLDKLLIGRVIGLQALGFYEKSYRLMMLPLQNITYVVTPVMHPIFADYQDNLREQRDKYMSVCRWLALIGFPLTAFLFFSADELVLLTFGSQWEASVPIFRILSLTVWGQILGATTGTIFLATNQTKKMFYVGLVNTLVNVCGLLLGIYIYGTVEAVAWMWVLTLYLGSWNWWYIFRYIFHTSIGIFIRSMLPALYSMIVTAFLLWIISMALSGANLFVSLCCKSIIWGITLLTTLQVTKTIDFRCILKKYLIR